MKALVAMLAALLVCSPALAQERKVEKKKPAAKKAAAKKADSSSDWSNFTSSSQKNLKADEEKRKAKAAKK